MPQSQELLSIFETNRKTIRRGSPSVVSLLLFALLITLFGIYIGNLLFGTSSLEVLYGLKNRESALESRVLELQQKNATLQKEYFELKHLEPN